MDLGEALYFLQVAGEPSLAGWDKDRSWDFLFLTEENLKGEAITKNRS